MQQKDRDRCKSGSRWCWTCSECERWWAIRQFSQMSGHHSRPPTLHADRALHLLDTHMLQHYWCPRYGWKHDANINSWNG